VSKPAESPNQKGTSEVNGNSTRRVKVEPGGTGVVAHVGLHAVGAFADRPGLGDALSGAVHWRGPGMAVHDRGKVLTQAALVLAGGGESCLDIEHLRAGPDLFGSVPSDTTVARTFAEITGSDRDRVAAAVAPLREQVWSRASATAGDDAVLLDIDASLVEIHSENKEQTAATFKGGYGFHPMFCFADATGETLAAMLRAGNTGANTVTAHVTLLDQAMGQLPQHVARGHSAGDDQALVQRNVVVRTDSAGCTEGFLGRAGSATSGSLSPHGATPRSKPRSSMPKGSSRCGPQPLTSTARSAPTPPRWLS
jgi:hypothetical protein